jgi:hypothetical protein
MSLLWLRTEGHLRTALSALWADTLTKLALSHKGPAQDLGGFRRDGFGRPSRVRAVQAYAAAERRRKAPERR